MVNIKAVIFDMDGVIVDSEPIHFESDKMIMRYYGKEITDEELFKYIGMPSIDMWEEVKVKYGLTAQIEEISKRQSYYKKLLVENRELEPFDGIIQLLDKLKSKKIRIGLASSSSREFIELMLSKLGLKGYFEAIMSGEDVENGKPAPDIFLKASEQLNVESSSCLVIEDSMHGVKAAKSAGMKCIGFKSPNSLNQDLSLADEVVDSIISITRLI